MDVCHASHALVVTVIGPVLKVLWLPFDELKLSLIGNGLRLGFCHQLVGQRLNFVFVSLLSSLLAVIEVPDLKILSLGLTFMLVDVKIVKQLLVDVCCFLGVFYHMVLFVPYRHTDVLGLLFGNFLIHYL